MSLTKAAINFIEKTALSEVKDKTEFSRMSAELGRISSSEVKKGEVSFKGNIEKEYPWGDVLKNPESMRELEFRIAKNEAEAEAIKAERNPSKMAKDVAERLVEEKIPFMEEEWRHASLEERLEILNKAYRIIAEEACIPDSMIESGGVYAGIMRGNVKGETICYFDLDEDKNIKIVSPVQISFNEIDLANPDYDLHSALSTLYHETVHVMQYESISKGGRMFTYAEMQEEWKQHIISSFSGKEVPQDKKNFTDYLSEPMETYAHMQQGYFEKMLNGMENEYINDLMSSHIDESAIGSSVSKVSEASLTVVPISDGPILKPVKIPC